MLPSTRASRGQLSCFTVSFLHFRHNPGMNIALIWLNAMFVYNRRFLAMVELNQRLCK